MMGWTGNLPPLDSTQEWIKIINGSGTLTRSPFLLGNRENNDWQLETLVITPGFKQGRKDVNASPHSKRWASHKLCPPITKPVRCLRKRNAFLLELYYFPGDWGNEPSLITGLLSTEAVQNGTPYRYSLGQLPTLPEPKIIRWERK